MATTHRPRKRLMAEINVVPYIDVMLVLLVIFMITAPLLNQGVQVSLPEVNASALPTADQETFVVSVDHEGHLYLDAQAISREGLREKMAKVLRVRPQTEVALKADAQVPYQAVAEVMADLQQAGVTRLGLVTQPPTHPPRERGQR